MFPVFSYCLFGFSQEQNTASSVCVSQAKCNEGGVLGPSVEVEITNYKRQNTDGCGNQSQEPPVERSILAALGA